MSRIGKLPVAIPSGVQVQADGSQIVVKGPKGSITRNFDSAIRLAVADNTVLVSPVDNTRHARAMHGTARSIIAAMVQGVTKGFEKNLSITGVGFRANLQGTVLDLALGKSHPIQEAIPAGLTVTVNDQTKIKVQGFDKQAVGEFAARIKRHYPVEPYKGKGVTIEGQHVRRKEGKKAG
jgi:large subunit ribosomal protein L6